MARIVGLAIAAAACRSTSCGPASAEISATSRCRVIAPMRTVPSASTVTPRSSLTRAKLISADGSTSRALSIATRLAPPASGFASASLLKKPTASPRLSGRCNIVLHTCEARRFHLIVCGIVNTELDSLLLAHFFVQVAVRVRSRSTTTASRMTTPTTSTCKKDETPAMFSAFDNKPRTSTP